jgi:polysaccharide export outer membrane protein
MCDEKSASKKPSTKHASVWAIAQALIFFAPIQMAAAQQLVLSANTQLRLAIVRKPPLKEVNDTYQLDLRYQNQRYRLCPSDVILVTFPVAPGFDQTVTIEPDGFASMAKVGDIHLEGLTTQESAESIQSAYARIMHDPLVAVELKDFKRPYFIVTGEVNRPGKYDLRGFTSVTEALAVAGGFNGGAKRSTVLLFRRAGNEWYEVKLLNLKRLFQGRDVNEDVELHPGDMLVVPSATLSRIRRLIP